MSLEQATSMTPIKKALTNSTKFNLQKLKRTEKNHLTVKLGFNRHFCSLQHKNSEFSLSVPKIQRTLTWSATYDTRIRYPYVPAVVFSPHVSFGPVDRGINIFLEPEPARHNKEEILSFIRSKTVLAS
jgi:hypothetical protein